ncbi:hypothetical protein R1flu_014971 [Riccia fluitans]|uniref:GBF-interacting protein 1 N-terminal domain-containing protein n=1 Tax=Riccia fluitans TaxID=41844 RepID=A0ABD1YI01_9MARC
MSSSRAGGGSGSAAIPANARKTVQSLREIVPNSEDEIYAMLIECNMDANETVQRLLNEDPFHEVKRRRDKKKEGRQDSTDRARPANGVQGRGGGRGSMSDRGTGRGSTLPRNSANEFNGGGRGKSFAPRDNGNVNSRASSTYGGPSSSTNPSYGQQKAHPPGVSSGAPAAAPASTTSGSTGHPNGSTGFSRPASVSQSTWGASSSGHATMADIVKANGAPPAPPVPLPAAPLSTPPVGNPLSSTVQQPFTSSNTNATPSVSSGVYSSSTDPVLHPSLDPRATGTPGAIKREVGTVGSTRPKQDWPSGSLNIDSTSGTSIPSQSLPSSVAAPSLDIDNQVARPSSPPASASPPVSQERPVSHAISVEPSVGAQPRQGSSSSPNAASGTRSVVVGGPFSTRPVYQPQQHPVGTQKGTGGGLEWKPKPTATSSTNMGGVNTPSQSESVRSSPASGSVDSVLSAQSSKLQSLNIHDDQPVIIPNHLQVPESERTHLSFGSFGAGFGTSFSTSFGSEEKSNSAIAESIPVIDTTVEQPSTASVVSSAPATLNQNYIHSNISVPEENLVSNIDTPVVSMPPPTVQQPELPKSDPVIHQTPHYPYLPTVPNYAGFSLVPQIPAGQYTYEATETPPQDVTRLPSLVPYTDPTPSYYTPPFRPSSDGDARYPPFITSNASSKYNGNLGLINLAGQGLSSSQETVNNGMPSSVSTTQTSQTGAAQTVQTVPQPQQQPLPLHAYTGQPAGAPIGHFPNMFGYQYITTPSFAYMHTHAPYQHNYTTTSGYPQPPSANSYPPTAASSYPPAGATTVKYLSQYKPGAATGSAPHSAAVQGYGGYATAPSGYGATPTVTGGSATGYDDVGVPQQYKDNNLYIPNQQDGNSTVWIQAQLSRDMAAAGGMQTSSYYNLGQQGQHTYAHTQQPSHAHAHPGAYASLYHPSQNGPAPTAHQLLQQPQSLGAQGAGGRKCRSDLGPLVGLRRVYITSLTKTVFCVNLCELTLAPVEDRRAADAWMSDHFGFVTASHIFPRSTSWKYMISLTRSGGDRTGQVVEL